MKILMDDIACNLNLVEKTCVKLVGIRWCIDFSRLKLIYWIQSMPWFFH
jgi:hypothetical protein